MLHMIKQLFTMVWSFWNIFKFEVQYSSYANREITAEYLPAVVPASALAPIKNEEFVLETDLIFSIFFSFLFFSVLFVLSSCSRKFLKLLLLIIVVVEFLVGRIVVSYFKQQYVQLLVLRVERLTFALISFFLILLSCLCCQFSFPPIEFRSPKNENRKGKNIFRFDSILKFHSLKNSINERKTKKKSERQNSDRKKTNRRKYHG